MSEEISSYYLIKITDGLNSKLQKSTILTTVPY
jgi:hypothetical protein